MKSLGLLILAALGLALATGCIRPVKASAAFLREDGGGAVEARFMGMCDRVRLKPGARAPILDHLERSMRERGTDGIEERLRRINKVFDQAVDMPEDVYQRRRAHLAKNLRRALHGGVVSRQGAEKERTGRGRGGRHEGRAR